MKIYVHSRRDLGITGYRKRFEKGLEHDVAPYGFDAAERLGHQVTYSEDWQYSKVSRFLFRRLNYDILHAIHNIPRMWGVDVIWTLLEWEWLAVSALQDLRLIPRVPVVGNCVWMFDQWPEWSEGKRRRMRARMTEQVYLTLHSNGSAARAAEFVPDRQFHLTHFGISTRAFPVTPPKAPERQDRPIRVYSIGDDRTRDWPTMLEAFGNDPRFEIKIVCRWLSDEMAARYSNLAVPRDITADDQRRFYEEADVVVMPMRENCFSGITVLCEAAAMGKPIVASRTGGTETYFDDGEVKLVPPEDAKALREAVLSSTPDELHDLAQRAQQRFLASDYSSEGMVRRYLEMSERLVQRRSTTNPMQRQATASQPSSGTR